MQRQPGHALSHHFAKAKPPESFPFPPFLPRALAEIHRPLQRSFPERAGGERAGAVGTFSNRGPLEIEVCSRSRMESGATMQPAGLSAAARAPVLGHRAPPCADSKITGDGWAGPVPPGPRAVGAEASSAVQWEKVELCPVARLPPPLCFPPSLHQMKREIWDFQLLLIPSCSAHSRAGRD